jgi:hypothetical protein
MLLNSALLVRLVALLLAAFIGNAFLEFSATAEPDEFNTFTIFFGVAFGMVSQAGLLASTTKFGLRYKLLTAALMLPFFLLLLAANYDSATRLIGGNPLSASATVAYIVGVLIYVYGYVFLFRQQSAT